MRAAAITELQQRRLEKSKVDGTESLVRTLNRDFAHIFKAGYNHKEEKK